MSLRRAGSANNSVHSGAVSDNDDDNDADMIVGGHQDRGISGSNGASILANKGGLGSSSGDGGTASSLSPMMISSTRQEEDDDIIDESGGILLAGSSEEREASANAASVMPQWMRTAYTIRFWFCKRESSGIPVNALVTVMVGVLIVIVTLHQTGVVNSYEKYRLTSTTLIVDNDLSSGSGEGVLSLHDISMWCLNFKKNLCQCSNPLRPMPRLEKDGFKKAHKLNKQMALQQPPPNGSSSSSDDAAWDVVFYGDSITEGFIGRSYGTPVERKSANLEVFQSFFGGGGGGADESGGSNLNGLALGISGDKCTNLLWRLQHGELPPTLNAKVFWVLIGTNDLPCSDEVISMGIIRIVDEIRKRSPESKIVINGLLPRATEDTTGVLVEHSNTAASSGSPSSSNQKKNKQQQPNNNNGLTKWGGVVLINQTLRQFAQKNEHVHYFDAFQIFTKSETFATGQERISIVTSLMDDFLHPTAEGYRKWSEAIVETLRLL